MRRSPFYAYPPSTYSQFQHMFPTQRGPTAYSRHRPPNAQRSSSPSSSAPARRSVDIPVRDSSVPANSPTSHQRRPSHPSLHKLANIDPHQAAVRIQSRFRGFAVRHHRPIPNLRSILSVRKELEHLKAELESPGFASKIRGSDKERLRFSETVMALILRLDAVEGSLPEVRSQRKEATKMAIGLQDAVDAIVMQPDDDLASTASVCTLDEEGQENSTMYAADVAGIDLHEMQRQTQEAQPIIIKEAHLLNNDGEVIHDGDDKFGVGPQSSHQPADQDVAVMSKDATGESMLSTVGSDLTSLDNEAVPEADKVDEASNEAGDEDALIKTNDVSEHDKETGEDPSANELIQTRNAKRESQPCALVGDLTSTIRAMDVDTDGFEVKSAQAEQNADFSVRSADNNELTPDLADGFEVKSAQAEQNADCSGRSADKNEVTSDFTSPSSTENGCPPNDVHASTVRDVQGSPVIVGTDSFEVKSARAEQNADFAGRSADDNEITSDLTSRLSAENDCPPNDFHASTVRDAQGSPVSEEPPHGLGTFSNDGHLNDEEVEMPRDPSTNVSFMPDSKLIESSQSNGILQPCHHCFTTEGELMNVVTKGSSPHEEVRPHIQGNRKYEVASNERETQYCEVTDAESSSVDKLLLQQLSHDCKQLQAMLGKLLVRSRAQSKVICVLSDRLEALEQRQQQVNNKQHVAQRKRKNGSNKSKRNIKACQLSE